MSVEEKARSGVRPCVSMDGKTRSDLRPGMEVDIVLKKDQPTGRLTRGIIKEILTNSPYHPRGIKVRLTDGRVGRVQRIISPSLSGMKLWDLLIAVRAYESLTALSRAFQTGELAVDGEEVRDPEHVLPDGRHIIRLGARRSCEVLVAGGQVDRRSVRFMG